MTSTRFRAAVGRGTRTGVVAAAGFAVGHWALDSTDVAVFGTFTGLALSGIADFGGTIAGRTAATAVAAAAGVALTSLGSWAATEPVAVQVAIMFATATTVTYLSVLGGYAAAGAVAVILFYLVAAGSPAPLTHLPDRLVGVVIGGSLAVAAGALLWPQRATRTVRIALADALEHLIRDLGDPSRGSGQRPLVRQVIQSLEERPSAPTGRARAALYLINDLERLEGLVSRLEPSADPTSSSELDRSAAFLSGCANALRTDDPATLPATPDPVLQGFTLPDRVLAVAMSTVAHCTALLSHGGPSMRTTLDHMQRRLHANLTLRSVNARDALRAGLGLAGACAVAGGFGLAHGFWVAFATLTVLRSSLRVTARRVGAAIAGTLAGCAGSVLLVEAIGTHTAVYAVLLPAVIALAITANTGIGFLAGQAGFTLAIVVLFNLLSPAGWHVGLIRIQDVAVGALTGAVVGASAWPRGARGELSSAIARLASTANTYLASTVRTVALDPIKQATREDLDDVRKPALAAALRADSTLAQYLAEAPPPDEAATWAGAAASAHRRWYAADLLRISGVRPTTDPSDLDAAADRILSEGAQRGIPSTRLRHCPDDPLLNWLDDLIESSPTQST